MNKRALYRSVKQRLVTCAGILIALAAGRELKAAGEKALEIVLVEPEAVTPAAVSQWKQEAFKAVAVVLDERTGEATYRAIGQNITDAGLDVYCWIEVGRNPKMATEHPRWMAALGSHEDWQKNFPRFPEPGVGEVAKAFPWVPIGYRETFDAHLARIEQLLKRAPPGWRGLLLNDLQAGPSSCGCGNLLCRWAIDYFVPSTATKLDGNAVAARFVSEVRRRAGEKLIIPVWTTECSEVDLPPEKHQGRRGTGFCGTVGCTMGACPQIFSLQWSALASEQKGPMGLLTVHTALQRTQTEFGGGPGWVTNAIGYVDQTVPKNGGKAISPDRLWVVIDGSQKAPESIARKLAANAGVGGVIVARAKIDQSYQPQMISTK